MNRFDMVIMSFIDGLAHLASRWPIIDKFILLVSGNTLIKGGAVIAVIWWIWFRDEGASEKRQAVLAGVFASFLGLVVARILTHLVFRVRPLNIPQLAVPLPCALSKEAFEGAGSFPSDHAVLFFALATGIFFASRRAGWLVFIYVSVVICLPRLYLGLHYPTDILAGAAIGVLLAWLFNLPAIRKPATMWALRWMDSEPALFYPCFFLLTYQIAELFNPLRTIVGFFIHGGTCT
jgi:undecaprenyl-diphosphatase